MNEKKKILIILCVFVCLVGFIFAIIMFENKKSEEYLEKFYSTFSKKENSLVVVGRDNCGWCNLFIPILDDMKERYGFDYLYINTNELSNSVLNKFLSDIKIDDFGTPLTLVVNDGKVVDSLSGAVTEDVLLEFLKEYNFVEEKEELLINYIDYDKYKKIIKSKSSNIIVVGQKGCSYCFKSIPIFNKLIKEKEYKVNYLYYDTLEDDQLEKFTSSLDFFQTVEWGTPVTLIVKDGKVIDYLNGLYDFDEYVNLFEKNGI